MLALTTLAIMLLAAILYVGIKVHADLRAARWPMGALGILAFGAIFTLTALVVYHLVDGAMRTGP